MIDEMSGRSQMGSDPSAPRFMFTAKLEIKYRQNVPIGQPLHLIGKAGRSRGTSAEAWAGVYLEQTSELLAEGTVLLVDVRPDRFDLSRLDDLGWQVYPE